MIVNRGRLVEIKMYDGEVAAPYIYLYWAGVDTWLSSFRDARQHQNVPCILSTGRRAYIENQLAAHGFTLINGQIPTPIISYWFSDIQRKKELDHPREVKWFNTDDNSLYPDMIPYDATLTVSLWASVPSDLFSLEAQFQASFNQTIHWIEFRDAVRARRQLTPFIMQSRTDATNYEPGDKGEVQYRVDFTLKSEIYQPLAGMSAPIIKRVFIDFDAGKNEILYLSGVVPSQGVRDNLGNLNGVISPGYVYISGIVNSGSMNQENIQMAIVAGFGTVQTPGSGSVSY